MQVTDAMVEKAFAASGHQPTEYNTIWMRAALTAAMAELWRPVSGDSSGLLYFPAETVGAHRQATLSAMMKVGCASDFPYRRPTHFMPLPAPPMGK